MDAILEQLLSSSGYKGYRIDESEYSRQYENGAFVPQHHDGGAVWRSFYHHTRDRSRIGTGPRSWKSTSISYKTPKGAMAYLLKNGLKIEEQ